jgi:hypothetical protein
VSAAIGTERTVEERVRELELLVVSIIRVLGGLANEIEGHCRNSAGTLTELALIELLKERS